MADLTNQYTPRMMDTAMKQSQGATSFLRSMVGIKKTVRTNKKYIEMDKVFGDNVSAQTVARDGSFNVVGRSGFSNGINIAPYYKERKIYTPSDVDVREAGSTVYEDGSSQLDSLVADDLVELYKRLDRTDEHQLAVGLQTGTVPVQGRGVDYTIDFGMNASNKITLSGTARWTEATSNKLLQIADWGKIISDSGAPGARWIVGSRSSMDDLITDATVAAMLDNRRINRGEINFEVLSDQRATYLGQLVTYGVAVDLYVYDGIHSVVNRATGAATSTPYMNANTIIMGSGNADVRQYYTKIENFKANNFTADRFPHFWQDEDGGAEYLQVESGPLTAICQPDAFVTVVTTS